MFPWYFSGEVTNWPRLPCYSLVKSRECRDRGDILRGGWFSKREAWVPIVPSVGSCPAWTPLRRTSSARPLGEPQREGISYWSVGGSPPPGASPSSRAN